MKKIAFVCNQALDFGGVESHLLLLFANIDQSRYPPVLMAPTSQRFRESVLKTGAQVVPIAPYQPLGLGTISMLRTQFRQEQIDLVNLHSPAAAITGRIAARLSGLPALVTVHSPSTKFYGSRKTFRATAGRVLYILADQLLNYCLTDQIVYVSNRVYQDALKIGLSPTSRSMVIPNGIDLSRFASPENPEACREKWHVAPQAVVIAYAGRLSAEKGVDLLLEAVHTLVNDQPARSISVWLIGDGDEKSRLMAMTRSLGLEKVVRFFGFQERVWEFLTASNIFVLPSRHEAMSMILLEALASGLPCVVTDAGENAAIVEDGAQGCVIPSNSSQAIVEALTSLLDNPGMRAEMGKQARQKAATFSAQKMAQAYQSLYQKMLGG